MSSLEGRYARDSKRKLLFIAVCIVLIIAVAGYALTINGRDLSMLECYRYVLDHILGKTYEYQSLDWFNDYLLWNAYLPRIVLGVFLGAGLAVCGVAMQATMNNPLADSYTTGISDGACFGAVAAIVTGFTFSSVMGSMGIVINAFIGGLIPAIILILLSNLVRMSPATMILVGIALSYIFSGLESSIMVLADADSLKEAYLWQIGTLGDIASWNQCYIPIAVTIVSTIILWLCSNKLNLLSLGEDSARSLGLDVQTFKTIIMIIVSITVAALVSYVGIVGFIGLVAPHLVRMILGGNNRYVIPASALVGSLLILVADLISRTVIAPEELRVGIVISMIGAPIFLYIILSRKRSYGEVFRCSGTISRMTAGCPTSRELITGGTGASCCTPASSWRPR
ncbi:MAG: iron ABC transporter permease [Thermoplasmata archaeon]|nr:iron ABC transporter permease [Thermoplasmata archaeon]